MSQLHPRIKPMVDAHCHLDLYKDPAHVVAEAEANKVYTIAVTNAPSVFRHTQALVEGTRYARPAVGLHPELVHTHGHQLDMLRVFLKETRYVGEIGLDYSTTVHTIRQAQREALSQILTWCAEYKDKILTLHSRKAAADTIAAVGKDYPGKVILHWFSGIVKELEQSVSHGMYFSINTAMVNSMKGCALISHIPAERVLTETDGPFIKLLSNPAKPSNIDQVLHGLAKNWQISFEEAREKVLTNFRKIIELKDQ